jgi:hypothetical protein
MRAAGVEEQVETFINRLRVSFLAGDEFRKSLSLLSFAGKVEVQSLSSQKLLVRS